MLWTRVLVCSVLNLFLLICPSVVKVSGKEDCRAGAAGGDADRERRPDGEARAGAAVPLSEGGLAVSPRRALPGPPCLNGNPPCFPFPLAAFPALAYLPHYVVDLFSLFIT